MNPGRELDALVAEKVMGIPVTKDEHGYWPPPLPGKNFSSQEIPDYSLSITATFPLIEEFQLVLIPCKNGGWLCGQARTGSGLPEFKSDEWFEWYSADGVFANTAPLAICLAALKACGVELP